MTPTVAILVLAALLLATVLSAIWARREIIDLRATMEAGPRGYWSCDKNGGDTVVCPACAFNSGDVQSPIYGDELWEWGDDAACFECKRLLPGNRSKRK